MTEPTLWREIADAQIWMLQGPATPQSLRRFESLLADDEIGRLRRLKAASARQSFILSRGGLRTVMGLHLEQEPGAIRFRYDTHGKPYIENEHGPTGLQFNVSHSGDLHLFALIQGRDIGVDVERVSEDLDIESLAGRFFATGEMDRLMAVPPEERRTAFFRCWTRKEAYLKATGLGMSLNLGSFEVSLLPDEPPAILHTPPEMAPPNTWRVWDLDGLADYAASLVIGP